MRHIWQVSRAGVIGAAIVAGLFACLPAHAQDLLPKSFFNSPVDPAAATAIEANELVFDAATDTISARGDVVLSASGYTLKGQELVYRRGSGELDFTGRVTIIDPSGNVSESDSVRLTGGLKQAFLDALTITAFDGSRITADNADYSQALQTILTNATYAPCGECIDDNGGRIGWSMHASRVIYNAVDGSVTLEQPSLALLGIPVAWLPYLWLPDLSDSALANLPRPSLDYSDKIGLKVEVPVSVYSSSSTDIILSPTLVSNQGLLLGAEWVQRFDRGSFSIKASGLYQFNPMAFTAVDSQREWRGAVQSKGQFVPIDNWTVGFSYAAFTDSRYFDDYRFPYDQAEVNQVYATSVTSESFVDARVQQFNVLGATDQTRGQQGMALPNVRVERRFLLSPSMGHVDVEAKLLGIYREFDSSAVVGGTTYTNGFAGRKLHGMLQASWQNQIIHGGLVFTPFAGLRAGGAVLDGDSTQVTAPPDGMLWDATPIAALDIRYPMVGYSPGMVHMVEPIAQLVYRGASNILPGITNEDSQSLAFDDSTLFSYNRFTGIDRQETGLRANLGIRYVVDLEAGGHLELVAGQSFQLAGQNAFANPDPTQVGVGSGLEGASSYSVLGAYATLGNQVKAGGKVQIDPARLSLTRASFGVTFVDEAWAANVNYRYTQAVPATGLLNDQHEIGGDIKVPITEYWSLTSIAYWDLAAKSPLVYGAGVAYDDGYLEFGLGGTRTGPTHVAPDDTRFTASFRLKAPAGFAAGYSGAFSLPEL